MVDMSRSGVRPPAGTFLHVSSFFNTLARIVRSPHSPSPSSPSSIFITALFCLLWGCDRFQRCTHGCTYTQSTRPTCVIVYHTGDERATKSVNEVVRVFLSPAHTPIGECSAYVTRTTTHISLKTAKATRACMHGARTRIVLLFGLLRKMDLVAGLNGFEILLRSRINTIDASI